MRKPEELAQQADPVGPHGGVQLCPEALEWVC